MIERLTQEDTYRGDGLNLYAYCENNPVMYYDPSGHYQEEYGNIGITESGTSRTEQIDTDFDSGVNTIGNGSLDFEGGLEPGALSNVDARKWYLEQEAKIPDLIDDSLLLEQQARQAFDLRNQYRTQARELM